MTQSENSIAAELMQQINLIHLRPVPNYLAATDAISAAQFKQTPYASKYTLDCSNVYWGSTSNDSHVFDLFAEFTGAKDGTTTQLNMLQFVSKHNEHYKWDGHVFFRMHNLDIDTWVNYMTYWQTRADKLAIYSLCDMLQKHCFIITGTRPWMTVHPTVTGTEMDILDICPVKLVHLRDYCFGRLLKKVVQTNSTDQYVETVPVFPELIRNEEPESEVAERPTFDEINTAQALLMMQNT